MPPIFLVVVRGRYVRTVIHEKFSKRRGGMAVWGCFAGLTRVGELFDHDRCCLLRCSADPGDCPLSLYSQPPIPLAWCRMLTSLFGELHEGEQRIVLSLSWTRATACVFGFFSRWSYGRLVSAARPCLQARPLVQGSLVHPVTSHSDVTRCVNLPRHSAHEVVVYRIGV